MPGLSPQASASGQVTFFSHLHRRRQDVTCGARVPPGALHINNTINATYSLNPALTPTSCTIRSTHIHLQSLKLLHSHTDGPEVTLHIHCLEVKYIAHTLPRSHTAHTLPRSQIRLSEVTYTAQKSHTLHILCSEDTYAAQKSHTLLRSHTHCPHCSEVTDIAQKSHTLPKSDTR